MIWTYGVVGDRQDVLVVLELRDNDDRAEDLLLDDLGIWLDVGEDRWLDKVSLVTESVAADQSLAAVLLSVIDVTHDAVEL